METHLRFFLFVRTPLEYFENIGIIFKLSVSYYGFNFKSYSKTHIVWLDVVRLVAMFTVVCCHSADPFNFYPGEPPANIAEIKWWGAVYGSLLRPCVPLFVMITGALLLPVKGEVAPFYRKRIGRVFWPFLIWSVIYNLFPWITGLLGVAPEVILDFSRIRVRK